MRRASFQSVLIALNPLSQFRFFGLFAVILLGTGFEIAGENDEDSNRIMVAQLITGPFNTWEEGKTFHLGRDLVFRISLYKAGTEGRLLPHEVRSLDNLEIHLQDAYPDRNTVLYPLDMVEINGHELFVIFPRREDFFNGLERIVLVVTDQNDLASIFRQIINFSATNLLGQLPPASPVSEFRKERAIAPCSHRDGSEVTVAQLIQCHLDSIGSNQALARSEIRLSEGFSRATGRVFTKGGHGSDTVEGQSSLLSNLQSTTFRLQFESDYYPLDGFSFDGKRVLRPATNSKGHHFSYLAEFFVNCPEYLSFGLMGGVLSISWPLLDSKSGIADFEFLGLEQEDEKEYLVLRRRTSRNGTVRLFFDPDSMQHLMTKYSGETLSPSRFGPRRKIRLIERFGEFRFFDEFCLPSLWRVTLVFPQDSIELETRLTHVFHKNVLAVNH